MIWNHLLDENREDIACFLVRSGCDVNAVRKPGPGGGGGDAATDQMTPLHLCCSWGLENTVQTLLEHGAKVNARVGFKVNARVDFKVNARVGFNALFSPGDLVIGDINVGC